MSDSDPQVILDGLPVRIGLEWFWNYDDDGNRLETGRYQMVASVRCRLRARLQLWLERK